MYYENCEFNPRGAKTTFILDKTLPGPILVDINFSVF